MNLLIATSKPCFTPPRPVRRLVRTRCNSHQSHKPETERWFFKRLERTGYDKIRQLAQSPLHPIAKETWTAMQDIYGLGILETPLEPSPWLYEHTKPSSATSQKGRGSVLLKLETHQVTGSFKARGAAHKLLSLSQEELERGVVTSSTGNHALAMLNAVSALENAAYAGQSINLSIYIPSTVSSRKLSQLQAEATKSGAKIIVDGEDCVQAERAARTAAMATNQIYVSPYNDVHVAGGQGTIAVELLMALPPEKLDVVLVPVGGGGLIAGIAALLKSVKPSVKIIGCQPEVSDVMRRSVEAGEIVDLPWEPTLSEASAGGVESDSITMEPCRAFVDEWVTVSEAEIAHAMVGIYGHHGYNIEGAAGVAVAAYLKAAKQGRLRDEHAVVICCGSNVSQEIMDKAYQIHTASKSRSGSLSSVSSLASFAE